MCKLSIITINYNNDKGLQKTINSIIKQTSKDFEHIIIDGGSNDNSIQIIKEYETKYIGNKDGLLWISEKDKGIYNAMNKGIIKANGEYVLFLNSGDCLNGNILSELNFNAFTDDIIFGNTILSNNTKKIIYKPNQHYSLYTFFTQSIPHQSTFIKRSLFTESLYNEEYKIISDWLLFVDKIIFENSSYKYIDKTISIFELDGISSDVNKRDAEGDKALKKILPDGIIEDYRNWTKLNAYLPITEINEIISNKYISTALLNANRFIIRPCFKILLYFKRI